MWSHRTQIKITANFCREPLMRASNGILLFCGDIKVKHATHKTYNLINGRLIDWFICDACSNRLLVAIPFIFRYSTINLMDIAIKIHIPFIFRAHCIRTNQSSTAFFMAFHFFIGAENNIKTEMDWIARNISFLFHFGWQSSAWALFKSQWIEFFMHEVHSRCFFVCLMRLERTLVESIDDGHIKIIIIFCSDGGRK